MRVVVIGKGLMLANIILGCVDAGVNVVGVLRYEQTCENPFKLFLRDIFNQSDELSLIKELRIPQLRFKSVNSMEFKNYLIKNNIDIVFVGTWREKIKKEIFDVPTIGMINLHPSLLPLYRGPNPYLQTILHGEKYSGVTLHLIDENYDTGAILSQAKVEIKESDTSKELREKTVVKARFLVREFLLDLNEKIITPVAQNEKLATYYSNISGFERMLNFKTQSSVEISRTIRAIYPFLPSYLTYKKMFFIVNPYKFKCLEGNYEKDIAGKIIQKNPKSNSLSIVCSDGKAICLEGLRLYRANALTSFVIKYFVKI